MKEHKLYFLWALLYALTAGLGFLPNPPEWAKALLILLTIGFFVPGGLLLWNGRKDAHTVHTVLGLSIASLSASLIFLVANLASTRAGNVVGVALHVLLGIFSAPMFCGQYWVLGLFGWACLFCAALEARRKLKK